MDAGRELQLKIWSSWSAEQRLQAAGKMIELVLALRDARLRRQHPEASDDELRQLRLREVLPPEVA
jgi:hypothetical protein